MHPPPAASLTDGHIVVRRYRPGDADALHNAIGSSVDHLRPWMSWVAYEPLPREARESLLATFMQRWDAGEEFVYAITPVDDERTIIGGCGLHPRIGAGGLEIGYWVRADRVRRGVASATARLLTSAALCVEGVDRVEIHHDRANLASAAVPRKLGFRCLGEQSRPIDAPGEEGVEWQWRMEAANWPGLRR